MRSLIAIAAVLSITSSGCYLGTRRTPKTVAEVISGSAVVIGTVALATRSGGDEHDVTGLMDGLLIAAGVVGLFVNIAAPTHPDGWPSSPAPAPRARTVTVTAPGLLPATVSLDH